MTVLIIIWLYESVSIPAAKAAQAASSNTKNPPKTYSDLKQIKKQ